MNPSFLFLSTSCCRLSLSFCLSFNISLSYVLTVSGILFAAQSLSCVVGNFAIILSLCGVSGSFIILMFCLIVAFSLCLICVNFACFVILSMGAQLVHFMHCGQRKLPSMGGERNSEISSSIVCVCCLENPCSASLTFSLFVTIVDFEINAGDLQFGNWAMLNSKQVEFDVPSVWFPE